MPRRGGVLGLGGGVARRRLQPQLSLGERVAMGSGSRGPVPELLVVSRAPGAARRHEERQPHDCAPHGLFFLPPRPSGPPWPSASGGGASAGAIVAPAGGPVSFRASIARYASTRGSSGRRSRQSSHTAFAASPSPAREHASPSMAAASRDPGRGR